MSATVLTNLQRLAEDWQNDLKTYVYATILEICNSHRINLYPGVQNTDYNTILERNGNITKPYAVGITPADSEIVKLRNVALTVKTAYAKIKDNVKRYKEKYIIRPGEQIGINQTKRMPFEVQLMMALMRTFGEDLGDCLFNGERDDSGLTTLDLFDGFETKVLAAIGTGEIAQAEGNYYASGSLAAPANNTDTTAFDSLLAWLRRANMYLLRNGSLIMTMDTYRNVLDALQNKTSYKADNVVALQNYINQLIGNSNINLILSQYMGTGDRLYLTAPGNMDFGMNAEGDWNFAQLMPDPDDPNIFSYWIQGDYGTRWNTFHKKEFFTNDGTLTAVANSGDYIS